MQQYLVKDSYNTYQYLHGYTFLYLILFLFSNFFASLHFKRSPVGRFWIQETIIKENIFAKLRAIYNYSMILREILRCILPPIRGLCPKEIWFFWGNKSSFPDHSCNHFFYNSEQHMVIQNRSISNSFSTF